MVVDHLLYPKCHIRAIEMFRRLEGHLRDYGAFEGNKTTVTESIRNGWINRNIHYRWNNINKH